MYYRIITCLPSWQVSSTPLIHGSEFPWSGHSISCSSLPLHMFCLRPVSVLGILPDVAGNVAPVYCWFCQASSKQCSVPSSLYPSCLQATLVLLEVPFSEISCHPPVWHTVVQLPLTHTSSPPVLPWLFLSLMFPLMHSATV